MEILIKDLTEKYKFISTHQITLSNESIPRFERLNNAPQLDTPCVYLWIKQTVGSESGKVLYVGKAGKGVARRCTQHQGGFINNSTGRKNAAELAEVLAGGTVTVTVMARGAEKIDLYGKTVSLYAAEENAFCALLNPLFNRGFFPEVEAMVDDIEAKAQTPVRGNEIAKIVKLINIRLKEHDEGTLDDMLAQITAYSPEQQKVFRKMLEFVEDRVLEPDHSLKLVGGYANQIKGCNGITVLGFGRLAQSNFSANGWVARIFLTDTPRLVFPKRFLNPAAQNNVEIAGNSFSPNDIDEFFNAPPNYLLPPA